MRDGKIFLSFFVHSLRVIDKSWREEVGKKKRAKQKSSHFREIVSFLCPIEKEKTKRYNFRIRIENKKRGQSKIIKKEVVYNLLSIMGNELKNKEPSKIWPWTSLALQLVYKYSTKLRSFVYSNIQKMKEKRKSK